jgi:uncharacterized membrane protein YgcG
VYGIASNAPQILALDTTTATVTGIQVPIDVCYADKKWSGGVVVGTHIYGIPCRAEKMIALDTDTGNVVGISLSQSALNYCIAGDKWLGGATVDGRVYGIPFSARNILVFDPFLSVDLATTLAAVGPLTLQCLDGTKFELPWPAKMTHGTTLNLRKLVAQACFHSPLGGTQSFKLVIAAGRGRGGADGSGASGGGGDGGDAGGDEGSGRGRSTALEDTIDVTVLKPAVLRMIALGYLPTTLTVVFE